MAVLFEQFNGLRLLQEAGEANGAIDGLNFDITRNKTQVGTRGGLVELASGTGTYDVVIPRSSDTLAVMKNTGSEASIQVVTISTATFGSGDTWGGATTRVTSAIANGSVVLIASRSGSTNEAAQLLSGGSVSGASIGSPRYLAVMPIENRTMAAHFTSAGGSPTGADGSEHAVFFTSPDTFGSGFGADDWVELDPFDGEEITGMVASGRLVWVIKGNAAFYFHGTSTDATGGAVFNFQRVSLPSRARATTNRGGANIVADPQNPDAVIVLLESGVYRVTVGGVTLLSRDITPMFDGTGTITFPTSGDWTFSEAGERLYLSWLDGSTPYTLVYDCVLGEWLLWSIGGGSSAINSNVVEWVDDDGAPVQYVLGGAKLFTLSEDATDDDGTAIVSHYQSGWLDLKGQTRHYRPSDGMVYMRGVKVTGTGSPTLSVFTDFGTSDANAAALTLGTAPTPARALHAPSYAGYRHSYKISASSGLWIVQRLELDGYGQ